MDLLVKAGALYGVEAWGWKIREDIKIVGEICKNDNGDSNKYARLHMETRNGKKSGSGDKKKSEQVHNGNTRNGRQEMEKNLSNGRTERNHGQPSKSGTGFKEAIVKLENG